MEKVEEYLRIIEEMKQKIFDTSPLDVTGIASNIYENGTGWNFDRSQGVDVRHRKIFELGKCSIIEAFVYPPGGFPRVRHKDREWLLFLSGSGYINVGHTISAIQVGKMESIPSYSPHQVLPGHSDVIHMLSFRCADDDVEG